MKNTKAIVFIHGLFMNESSWEEWIKFFEAKGYPCYAPSYPYHSGLPWQLRSNINKKLEELTYDEVLKSMLVFLENFADKPILVGHSMGGLLVQDLIALQKGVAGICIDSAAPKGIDTFVFSFYRSNIPVINPFKGNSVFVPSINWFKYAFCNTMSDKDTSNAFDKYVVPESRNIPRSILKGKNKINFNKPHAPLLFIAGEKDHIIPASLNKKNFDAYNDKMSIKTFKEFEGRSHFICGQENWEEVSEFVQNWILDQK